MENKKKKKCCSFFQSARLSSQTKIALILLSLILILFLVGCMILNIFLVSSYTYKEIYKLIDIDEFNELTFAENNLENIELQFENTFKNTLLSIINLYKELSNKELKEDFFKKYNDDFNLSFWNGTNDNFKINASKKSMLFTCEDTNAKCVNITKNDSYYFYSYFGIYLEKIFSNKKIFMNINEVEYFMHLLIICDYENKIGPNNTVTFYYPAYADQIKKLNHTLIKEYVINRITQKIKDISMYQEIMSNNLTFYDNLFLLPFYDEDKDNDDYTFDGYNLKNEIFSQNYTNNTDIKINEVAFMLLPKRDQETNEFLDINMMNIKENIGQIFFLVGINGTSKIIFDKLHSQNSRLFLLRTNYLFPYELTSKDSCYEILLLGEQSEDNKNINISKLKYLDHCFDKVTKIKKYKRNSKLRDYTTYDKLIEDFSIFRNNISFDYNSNIVHLYRTIEQNYLQKKATSFSKTITKATTINNQNFKITKSYSPLNIIYQINYFYPIDNIKMNILIKEEDHSQLLLEESKIIMYKIITRGVIFLIICVVLTEIIILIILRYFIEELNKPLNIINNPYFITGQIKEEEYENKNKSLNKANIISDKKIHIDEFKELIKSVSEALKSETEFKQKINKQEEDDMKLEMEYLNKEFEKNKIFNIMVDENKINNILEESNYSNEIIKHKTNIDNVKNDSFVKKSYLFREFVKVDDFEELDNSGENSLTIDNNTIFKDENSLQNPNSLFYDLFKTAFDENYVKRIEEIKIKKEIEKKKKSKIKNYTFQFDEEFVKDKLKVNIQKSKKNLLDFDKDDNINNIIEENDKKMSFKEEEIDIKNEKDNINNIDNFMNKSDDDEDKLIKLYTEDIDDMKKEVEDLLTNNKSKKDRKITEEEIDTTTKY